MFATVPRMRSYRRSTQQQQVEEKPEPGSDSTYGVRSIGSESDWGMGSRADDEMAHDDDKQEDTESPEMLDEPVPTDTAVEHVEEGTTTDNAEEAQQEWTPTVDRSTPLPTPTSPEERPNHQPPLSLSHGYLYDTERDNLSEPSSPASFASMPSYMSSLSRTSSLAGVSRAEEDVHAGTVGLGMGGSEELVIPTLQVSQSSATGPAINESRQRWSGSKQKGVDGKLKVVVLGDEHRTRAFIDSLKRVKEVVDLEVEGGRETYAVVGGDEVIATLTTGLSSEDVETRIDTAYTTLDSVLHPDPSPQAQGQLERLVLDYASTSDWCHLLFVLDAESSAVEALARLVPTLTALSSGPPLLRLPNKQPMPSSTSTMTRSDVPDSTPRPGTEGSSYFAEHDRSQGADDDEAFDDVQRFVQALSHIDHIRRASTTRFFSWRRSSDQDLSSSHHSHESSSAASGFEAAPPIMPTVARAQGGGEWEANLSRRLAKRRQSQTLASRRTSASGSGSGSGKRTTVKPNARRQRAPLSAAAGNGTTGEKDKCGPLFPLTPVDGGRGKSSSVGLGDLLASTFAPLRKRWRWGVLAAAAVALVVGWNWVKVA